jgi:hypothetical protein
MSCTYYAYTAVVYRSYQRNPLRRTHYTLAPLAPTRDLPFASDTTTQPSIMNEMLTLMTIKIKNDCVRVLSLLCDKSVRSSI